MKIEEETFGYRIRFLRKKIGMSREQLAERIDIALPTLAGYENNLREPKFQTIRMIANALNTSSDFLLCITDDPKPNKTSNDLNVLVKNTEDLNINGKKLTEKEIKIIVHLLKILGE